MIRKLVPGSIYRSLSNFLPFLRPKTEVTFSISNLGSMGLGWSSYLNAMPPSMAILENHPFSLGKVHEGPLLLQLELPDEIDGIERGSDDYGPLLFLLLNVKSALRHINVVLNKSSQLGYVHVRVEADSRTSFNQDVSAHYVDDDVPPHIVLP